MCERYPKWSSSPSDWPEWVPPSTYENNASSSSTTSPSSPQSDSHSSPSDVCEKSRESRTATTMRYLQQWMSIPPNGGSSKTAEGRDVSSDMAVDSSVGPTGHDGASASVQSVAKLNAMLVSAPASASHPRAQAECQGSAPSIHHEIARGDDSSLSSVEVPEFVPIIDPHRHHLSLAEVAAQLLRHSKWIASGLSHAAGPAPRLPSASLLSDAFRHALLPACSAAGGMASNRARRAIPTTETTDCATALNSGAAEPMSSLPWTLPLSGLADPSTNGQAQQPVYGYRGALVLLLFHPLRQIRIWARDVMLRLMMGTPPWPRTSTPSELSSDSGDNLLTTLLYFALQLLCTLKHISALPAQISFLGCHTDPSPTTAAFSVEVGDVAQHLMHDRMRTVTEGIFHLLTLLTAWDAQFDRALEDRAKTSGAVAESSSATPLLLLLGKCRTTTVLLGGSLVLYALQELHTGIYGELLDVLRDPQQRFQQRSPTGLDKCPVSQAAMKQLSDPLNALLSSNPSMPRSNAVVAIAIRRLLAKVLVHCFLDNATGLTSSREEKATRKARLEWLWTLAASLEPPNARAAAPLPADPPCVPVGSITTSRNALALAQQSRATREVGGYDGAGTDALILVPGRCAGWLLRPLLNNAARHFEWEKAIAVAKAKPNMGMTAAATDATDHLVAVLDKAVYGICMLLDSLATALPCLMGTTYLHDTLAAHEQQLLTLAIGGIVHTRSVHALRLHRLLLFVDVQAFVAGTAVSGTANTSLMNATDAGAVGVPRVCLQRVWLTLPTLIAQVSKCAAIGTEDDVTQVGGNHNRGPLSYCEVLVRLFHSLTVLVEDDAALCSQWLLLSPTKVMSRAPPPFHCVVQRCLRTILDTLTEQQDLLKRVWLGLPPRATEAARSTASEVAASRALTQEKLLLRLVFALSIAAHEDSEAGKLSEGLKSVFCVGVRGPVLRALSREVAVWVWRRVVLTQSELRLHPPPLSVGTPTIAAAKAEDPTVWDVTDAAVMNTVRTQGHRWLALLSQLHWDDMSVWEVQCGWWMSALLADVVPLDTEQRRALAEQVILALPTTPMLTCSEAATSMLGSTHDAIDRAASEGPCLDAGETLGQQLCHQSAKAALSRYNVVRLLFIQVLRKAEQYPRPSFAKMLLHISQALPPLLVARDPKIQSHVQPLLVQLCSRSPDVQQYLAQEGAVWLRRYTEQAKRTVNECLAEQERQLRQFEIEESTLKREEAAAAHRTVAAERLQRLNAANREGELDRERTTALSTAASVLQGADSCIPAMDAPLRLFDGTSSHQDRHSSDGTESSVCALLQQRLFPDRPPSYLATKQRHTSLPHGDGSSATTALDVDADAEDGTVTPFGVQNSSDNDYCPPPLYTAPPPTNPHTAPPAKAPKTSPCTAASATGPTPLDKKLQEINIRNTYRYHHAQEKTRMGEQLERFAVRTNIDHRQPPLIDDIIGSAPQCMAPEPPPLPEVFAREPDEVVTPATGTPPGTSTAQLLGEAAREYTTRFATHIALELRYSIIRGYEEFLESVSKNSTGSRRNWSHFLHESAVTTKVTAKGKKPPSFLESVLVKMLTLNPGVPPACVAVQTTREIESPSNSHQFVVFASRHSAADDDSQKPRVQTGATSRTGKKRMPAPLPIDSQLHKSTVGAAASQDLYTSLSEGDIVAVLLPLNEFLPTYLERKLGDTISEIPTAELKCHVKEIVHTWPLSWRHLGCAVQVYHVQALQAWKGMVRLCGSPSIVERLSSSGSPHTPRFLHVFRTAYSKKPSPTFYIVKLASLRASLMELDALYKVDRTHFAAALYDPRSTVSASVAFCDWATSLLSATTSSHPTPLVNQLCKRLLLHERPNSWQTRAIMATLYAACPTWDEGVAKKSVREPVPRAPELLVIEGPPGTGKTQTIGLLTLNLLHHLSETQHRAPRILVCAPSNCAVDETLLRVVRLREQLKQTEPGHGPCPAAAVLAGGLLRMGVRDKVDSEVLQLPEVVFFQDLVEMHINTCLSDAWGLTSAEKCGPWDSTDIVESRAGGRNRAVARTLGSAAVVFSTLGSLHNIARKVGNLTFDVVIVDEASQGTEPAVVQALTLATGICVLVGDSRQLQPTVLSLEASRCGLQRSLLVRLLACGNRSLLLRTQYRMHPDIVAFPNEYFYGSNLVTDESVVARSRMPDGPAAATMTVAQQLGRCPRFVFVDVRTSSMMRLPSGSMFNTHEAVALVTYMRQLCRHLKMSQQEMAAHICIITFYTAQKTKILSLLTRDELKSGLQVATVDSFQGKEKCITLLSCVRTKSVAQLQRLQGRVGSMEGDHSRDDDSDDTQHNPSSDEHVGGHGMGFLADWRRLNVALTRAQDLCVCFGSRDTLRTLCTSAAKSVSPPRAVSTVDGRPYADNADPLALYRMLAHAETHDLALRPQYSKPKQLATSSPPMEMGNRSATPPRAACVTYHTQRNLLQELKARARAAEAHGARSNVS